MTCLRLYKALVLFVPGILVIHSRGGIFVGFLELYHEIIIPLALDIHVGRRTEQHRIDQVVVEIHIQSRLLEFIQGRTRRTSRNEPGFLIGDGGIARILPGTMQKTKAL